MGDQRVEARPVLGGVDGGHGGLVRRIGTEAVDRLGREGDKLALQEQGCGRRDTSAVRGKPDGVAAHAALPFRE
jgi:hypothetical protein